MTLKLPLSSAFFLILILVLAAPAQIAAQTRRQTPRAQTPAPARTAAPAPTFDTLLAAHTFKLYGEIRSVGQLIRSNSINEILEPIMKLASPPKEFRALIKWLNTHADEVMTSRMLVAAWPNSADLPDAVFAIEFASPEEANKFQLKLKEFLPKVLPAPTPEGSPSPEGSPKQEVAIVGVVRDTGSTAPVQIVPQTAPPTLPYHLQQAGSLILITPRPFKLAKLRPAGSKLLAEDVNFRVARNRFNSEPIFFFIDVAEIEKEEKEQQKKFEEQRKISIAEMEKITAENEKAKAEMEREIEEAELEMAPPVEAPPVRTGVGVASDEINTQQMSKSDQFTFALMALSIFSSSYATEESKWPDAVGLALSLEGESFDVRALLINAPGEKSNPVPFFPVLSPGPALLPESPNILPADTEMLVTMSLDLGPIYTAISKPMPIMSLAMYNKQPGETDQPETLLASLEKRLKINIKDDLLPLVGSEVVLSVPLTGLDLLQPPKPPVQGAPRSSPSPSPSPSPDKETQEPAKPTRGPAVLLSLKDKEGMRLLLPKIIEAAAFKGASALASTERREDTELVSYANLLSYAFIGNFLVLSADPATTRHIVDSYLKHQTLATDQQFKNYTRWQPRMVQAQLYISPALMENYRTWVQQPNPAIDDQLRLMLTRLTIVPQPVTYSLSNEGFGPLHELHLPKNLVLMFITSIAGSSRPPMEDKPSSSNPN
ncbi:MAG TPA: DUF3352 domain-containing protein [Pyrinomonadaceae bacterium]|nr:DUF3352 domain-containing protein [Pyrinomonadaceae bacterium]